MNIAIIHSHLDGRGGSQRYAIEQARTFSDIGHAVEIFSCYHSPSRCYPEHLKETPVHYLHNVDNRSRRESSFIKNMVKAPIKAAVRWTRIVGTDFLVYNWRLPLDTGRLATLMSEVQDRNKSRFDIVFAHEGPHSAWAAVKFKKRHGTPIYWFCYDTLDKWYLDWMGSKGLYARIRRIFLNVYWSRDRSYIKENVDRTAVLDKNIGDRFSGFYGYRPDVVRGGISEHNLSRKRSDYLRNRYSLDPTTTILCCVTRFRRYRRVHDLFELGRRLQSTEGLILYINSPESETDYYDELMSRYRDHLFPEGNIIVDVEFPGSDDSLFEIYRSSDIFIFPNEHQTWGNAPLEAMASGTLAIVSDGCGISEVIRDITDTVYPVGDVDALEELVMRFMADPESMRDAARKQFEYVRENLMWSKLCGNYIREFERIISRTES